MFVCMTSDTASILVSFTACVNVEKKEVLITIICPRQTAYSTTSAQAHADIGGILEYGCVAKGSRLVRGCQA